MKSKHLVLCLIGFIVFVHAHYLNGWMNHYEAPVRGGGSVTEEPVEFVNYPNAKKNVVSCETEPDTLVRQKADSSQFDITLEDFSF